jgi:hypothetical protein
MSMSLVLAFIGSKGSVVAGDMREIILSGDLPDSDRFEEELYMGKIQTDEEMVHRAQELRLHLEMRDTKKKVLGRDGILIGEVSDFERGIVRKRRLYVTTGRYALAEIENRQFSRVQHGEAPRFVVLSNPFIQQIANQYIQKHWKGGGVAEAVQLIETIMKTAARKSASVSREITLEQTTTTVDLDPIIERDQKRPG